MSPLSQYRLSRCGLVRRIWFNSGKWQTLGCFRAYSARFVEAPVQREFAQLATMATNDAKRGRRDVAVPLKTQHIHAWQGSRERCQERVVEPDKVDWLVPSNGLHCQLYQLWEALRSRHDVVCGKSYGLLEHDIQQAQVLEGHDRCKTSFPFFVPDSQAQQEQRPKRRHGQQRHGILRIPYL